MKYLLCQLKYAFIITSTFCCYHLTSAQEKWPVNAEDLKFHGIEFRETKLLEQMHGIDCFEDNPLLEALMQCGGNQLHAKDGSFIAFNRFGDQYYTNDTTLVTIVPARGRQHPDYVPDPYHDLGMRHLRRARDEIKLFLPENSSHTWKQYINYYPQEQAKNKINADTIISYSFRLEPKDYYKGKYKNIWILVRSGSSVISTYALYEDMSDEKLAKFKAAVENSFIYDDTNKPIMHPKSLKAMKLQYNKQDMFIPAYKTGSFEKSTLKGVLNSKSQLHSKDGRFIVFLPSHPDIFTQEFADNLKKLMPGREFDFIDKQQVNQLRAEIKYVLGDEAALNFRNHLVYATTEQASSKFNADTVITYNIRLKPEDSYKERYNNLWSLTIQKKGRGYITLHCLYEDMPDKELALYKAAVENLLRYDD